MNEALANISAFSSWSATVSSMCLTIYMFLQAGADKPRRRRFFVFALVWLALTLIALALPYVTIPTYEVMRIAWIGFYVGSFFYLFEFSVAVASGIGAAVAGVGAAVWLAGYWHLATTVSYPLGFGIVGMMHLLHFARGRGFASCILGAMTLSGALFCAMYYSVLKTGNPVAITLGFLHWAVIQFCSVFLGWVHLPREMQGRVPVRVPAALGWSVVAGAQVALLGVILGMLVWAGWPPYVFLGAETVFLLIPISLYFNHRHQLVIYTDNIARLLDERTASLRKAQEQLTLQNQSQEFRLRDQDQELTVKNQIIARQRRLELAAQTAAEAAHDIHNMISPVRGHLDDLRARPEPEAVARTVDKIERQVDSLFDMTDQMLALSRRAQVKMQAMDLAELCRDVRERYAHEPVRCEAGGCVWIEGSWSQMSRAVSNLVSNAIEASVEQSGDVLLSCAEETVEAPRKCHLGFLSAGRYARVDVVDGGPGIARENVERIFEPFFSDGKSRQHASGSGLGLTIVAAVVDDHGGVLDLETRPGCTRFSLYFPLRDAPQVFQNETELSGNETVIVADDDSEIRRRYRELLESAGYFVLEAETGRDVIRHLQVQRADVLLLDVHMPEMSGLETFYAALHVAPGLRTILHTGNPQSPEVDRLKVLGVSEILQKPASRLEVLQTIRRTLQTSC